MGACESRRPNIYFLCLYEKQMKSKQYPYEIYVLRKEGNQSRKTVNYSSVRKSTIVK